MFSLLKKDFVFTKKMILISVIYSIVVPVLLVFDTDGKAYFADFLVPLAFVTAPLAKIMNKEDTKSGVILQKMIPVSVPEIIAARYLFVIILMMISELFLSVMKMIAFGENDILLNMKDAMPYLISFIVYYAAYLMVYYWKGYFATQFCIYALIIIVVLSNRIFGKSTFENLLQIKNGLYVGGVILFLLSFFASCVLASRKTVDSY
ncbi:ABC-2 family transporter protein [Lachnospiraceae bacterium A10]|nr:ABC-2 family transporter protein [Lachnospiraceae bacterium A10]